MTKNISLGGKSYEVSEEVAEKIDELVSGEDSTEVESFDDFVGKKLAFQCARYIYFGKVEKVNSVFIELSEAQIVFDTGEFSDKSASDAQNLPKKKVYLLRQSIESCYPTLWKE
jgi:hypothetical protein